MSQSKINKKELNENIIKFLFVASIGSVEKKDWINNSIRRAYLDFCRTMDYKVDFRQNENLASNSPLTKRQEKEMEEKKKEYYENCQKILKSFLEQLENGEVEPCEFDELHNRICNELIEVHYFKMNYGQAQKWLNMAIKYLFIYEEMLSSNRGIFSLIDVLHIPIDNVVLDILSGKISSFKNPIEKPKKPWSHWDKGDYIKYKECIKKINLLPTPFLWELESWIPLEKIKIMKKQNKS